MTGAGFGSSMALITVGKSDAISKPFQTAGEVGAIFVEQVG